MVATDEVNKGHGCFQGTARLFGPNVHKNTKIFSRVPRESQAQDMSLQVVHLHLEPFESEVVLSRLALVGDEHDDDNDEQEAASRRDAHDGRQGQQAV